MTFAQIFSLIYSLDKSTLIAGSQSQFVYSSWQI